MKRSMQNTVRGVLVAAVLCGGAAMARAAEEVVAEAVAVEKTATGTVAVESEVVETSLAASADVSVLSAYVWRGQVLNDEMVVQPSATITSGGFSLNTWGNIDTTDRHGNSGDFNEIDLTASYALSLGAVTLTVGDIEYLFPNSSVEVSAVDHAASPSTRELFVSASVPALLVVPSVAVYFDIDAVDSEYAVASLAYTHTCSEKLSETLSASLGYAAQAYNEAYFGVSDNAMNDALVGLSVSYVACSHFTITPTIQYAGFPDSDIKDGAAATHFDDNLFFGGVKGTCTF